MAFDKHTASLAKYYRSVGQSPAGARSLAKSYSSTYVKSRSSRRKPSAAKKAYAGYNLPPGTKPGKSFPRTGLRAAYLLGIQGGSTHRPGIQGFGQDLTKFSRLERTAYRAGIRRQKRHTMRVSQVGDKYGVVTRRPAGGKFYLQLSTGRLAGSKRGVAKGNIGSFKR